MWSALLSAASLATALLPGGDLLLRRPSADIVWLGEIHGAVEHPQLLADLISIAIAMKTPLVVALERPTSEQPLWEAYLRSDGGEDARKTFLSAPSWINPMQDGRSSREMFAIAELLRRAYQSGSLRAVRMIQPSMPTTSPDEYEAAMASAVVDAAAIAPGSKTLVFTGNAHANRGTRSQGGSSYTFAAGHLKANTVTTVLIKGGPGEAWNCQKDCGPNPTKGSPPHVRGVVWTKDAPGFDAVAWTGVATTASPPMAAPATRFSFSH